jgi:hypothetical protein
MLLFLAKRRLRRAHKANNGAYQLIAILCAVCLGFLCDERERGSGRSERLRGAKARRGGEPAPWHTRPRG